MEQLVEFAKDNLILSVVWVVLLAIIVYSYISPFLSKAKRVDNHQATLLINKEDAVVVDIRTQKDYKSGHIIGAQHIKPEDVRQANFTKLEKYKDTPIIVVCAMGNLAMGTANKMAAQGFSKVSVLSGGISAWQGASLPLSK